MLSIVIPSYNRRDSVLNLLRDIHAQEGADYEVIVVDDSSEDDSVEVICREFSEVKVLVNEVNSGPAVARNRGVREAKGEIIVGFDSDVTIPDRHLLRKITAAFQTESATACLALRILNPGGQSDDVERWWHSLPVEYANHSFLTSYFSGTAYAIRKDAMISAGLYPEIFYMHHEELELASRLLDQGDSIRHCPGLAVVHHASPVAARSYVAMFYHPRNQILHALLSYPLVRAVAYLLPRTIYQFVSAVKGGYLVTYGTVIRDALRLTGLVLKARRPLKKSTFRKISKLRSQIISNATTAIEVVPDRRFTLTDLEPKARRRSLCKK